MRTTDADHAVVDPADAPADPGEGGGGREPVRAGRGRRGVPVGLALPLLFNAWTLRQLLVIVSWPNDVPFHLSMVDWANGRLADGTVPIDGWFPRLSGGLPQFHHYQSLPHLLTGAVGLLTGPERAFFLLTYVLLVSWPVAVYICARAFGLSRRAGVVAAIVAPLAKSPTGYGFENFSYLWTGNGLWSQLWGMWGLPLGLAWSARAVRTGKGIGRAVAANALTVACHLPMAWFGLLSLGLWPLARPGAWRRRVPRAAAIGVLSLLASAWLLVPFLADQWATNASSFNGAAFFEDSFGWRRVLGWLLAGDLIDAGRLPLFSLVALLGLATCVSSWRRHDRPWARELPLVLLAATVLFVGRDPFGPLIDLLPGASMVFLHRYHAVIQLMELLLVGVGADAAVRWAGPRLLVHRTRLERVALAALALVVLVIPGVRQTVRFTDEDRRWVDLQRTADAGPGRQFAELVSIAHQRGDGRIYAGRINNWGRSFLVGAVPAPILLASYPVDSIGFNLRISSLSADLETYVDDSQGADLAQLGVRYVILPRGHVAPTGAFFLTNRGDFQLWEVPGPGLVRVVNLIGPVVTTDRSHLAERLLPPMRAAERDPDDVQAVDFEGRTAPGATARRTAAAPGRVVARREALAAGAVDATVAMDRAGTVLLQVNWHPRWSATVDGKEVRTEMAAPTWLAVPVGPGRHQIAFRYRPYPGSWPLLVLAALAIALAGWLSQRRLPVEPPNAGGAPPAPEDRSGPLTSGSEVVDPATRSDADRREPDDRGPDGKAAEELRSARLGRRGRRGALLVAVLAMAACGPPHRLPPPPDLRRPAGAVLPSAVLDVVLRSPTVTIPLRRALAPDRPTVVVFVPPSCPGCSDALGSLRAAAFGAKPFSVLVVGVPLPDPNVARASITQGLVLYGLKPANRAVIDRQVKVDRQGTVLVLSPTGRLYRRFDSLRDPAAIVAAATG